jgi:hypothetical protein
MPSHMQQADRDPRSVGGQRTHPAGVDPNALSAAVHHELTDDWALDIGRSVHFQKFSPRSESPLELLRHYVDRHSGILFP